MFSWWFYLCMSTSCRCRLWSTQLIGSECLGLQWLTLTVSTSTHHLTQRLLRFSWFVFGWSILFIVFYTFLDHYTGKEIFIHLSLSMIYHLACNVKCSDQSTGLGECSQQLTINIQIFTATTFRYAPWRDADGRINHSPFKQIQQKYSGCIGWNFSFSWTKCWQRSNQTELRCQSYAGNTCHKYKYVPPYVSGFLSRPCEFVCTFSCQLWSSLLPLFWLFMHGPPST